MFRTVVGATLALAAFTTTTAGAANVCLTDPAGDVVLRGTPMKVDEPHLDLVRLSVTRARHDLVVAFHTAGGPGDGIWSMTFAYDEQYEFFVRAQRHAGPWTDPRVAPTPVFASLTRWQDDGDETKVTSVELPGATVDFSRPGVVLVRVPLTRAGPAAPRAGATPLVVWARARQRVATAYAEYEDTAGCL